MAVTITYLWEGQGVATTNPPTQAQAFKISTVVATIVAGAAGDTSAVVTHDFNLPASDMSAGFPESNMVPQGDETTSPWWEASTNPNYTVYQKNTLGVGPTYKIFIHRPHTLVR